MIFVREVFAPGPGTRSKATFRWRPFQSALNGSLFFIPPPLVEVMILANKNLSFSGSCAEEDKKMTEEEAESAEIIS